MPSLRSCRWLLVLVATASLLLSSVDANPKCKSVCERREIRALSPADRDRYFRAVNQLKQSGRYDYYVNMYIDNYRRVHNSPLFLPWHRAFLLNFENELRELDPKICLHYWSWDLDSQAPEASPVWLWYGGNGDQNDCVDSGPFKGWRTSAPGPPGECLKRQFDDRGYGMSAFHSPEVINHMITKTSNYDDFRQAVEQVACSAPRMNIGGHFATVGAVNDPLFWAHQAFIDKIYLQWQRFNKEKWDTYAGKDADSRDCSPDDRMEPFGRSVRDVFDMSGLCYVYVDLRFRETDTRGLPECRRVVRSMAVNDTVSNVAGGLVGGLTGVLTGATSAVNNTVAAVTPDTSAAVNVNANATVNTPSLTGGSSGNVTAKEANGISRVDNQGPPPFTAASLPTNANSGDRLVATSQPPAAVGPRPQPTVVPADQMPTRPMDANRPVDFRGAPAPIRRPPPNDRYCRVYPQPPPMRTSAYDHRADKDYRYDFDVYNPRSRSAVWGLRRPRPCVDTWIRLNRFDPEGVRRRERYYDDLYDQLNGLYGYISPCSLYMRPDLMVRTLPRNEHFSGDLYNTGRVTVDTVGLDPRNGYQCVADLRCKVVDVAPNYCRKSRDFSDDLQRMVGMSASLTAESASNFMADHDLPTGAASQTQRTLLGVAVALVVLLINI